MVFKKIIFQNRYVALETPWRPTPLHGKCHLKFPFWFFAHLPNKPCLISLVLTDTTYMQKKKLFTSASAQHLEGLFCPANMNIRRCGTSRRPSTESKRWNAGCFSEDSLSSLSLDLSSAMWIGMRSQHQHQDQHQQQQQLHQAHRSSAKFYNVSWNILV